MVLLYVLKLLISCYDMIYIRVSLRSVRDQRSNRNGLTAAVENNDLLDDHSQTPAPRVPTYLDVFIGLQFTDVLLQEEQIQREIVPLATGGGQDTDGGQGLVGFQEAGISIAEEGTETGVYHHGDQRDEQHQVDEAANGVRGFGARNEPPPEHDTVSS